jgi:hypothetical protein
MKDDSTTSNGGDAQSDEQATQVSTIRVFVVLTLALVGLGFMLGNGNLVVELLRSIAVALTYKLLGVEKVLNAL